MLPLTRRAASSDAPTPWRATAFIAWGAGAIAALVTHYFAPALCVVAVGIVVSGALAAVLSRRTSATSSTPDVTVEDTTSAPV